MSNFIIAVGHTASGNKGCGVVARLYESKLPRIIGALVAEYLQATGQLISEYFNGVLTINTAPF